VRSTDVVIVGAGAAGLMCALTATARGREVLLRTSARGVGSGRSRRHSGSAGGRVAVTSRKPFGTGWIDRQIREARERGEFDNLPGTGKPLPDLDKPYDENWWVRQKLRS
jgi:predicted flavoprotein YhiN